MTGRKKLGRFTELATKGAIVGSSLLAGCEKSPLANDTVECGREIRAAIALSISAKEASHSVSKLFNMKDDMENRYQEGIKIIASNVNDMSSDNYDQVMCEIESIKKVLEVEPQNKASEKSLALLYSSGLAYPMRDDKVEEFFKKSPEEKAKIRKMALSSISDIEYQINKVHGKSR